MNHSPNDNYQLNQNLWSYPVVGAIQPLNNCDQYYNQMEQHFVVEWVFGSLLGYCLPAIYFIIFFAFQGEPKLHLKVTHSLGNNLGMTHG